MARESINAETLRGMLGRGERVVVVDVRRAEEYARGAVPGAVNHDVYGALNDGDERAMEGLELPEKAQVVTVCNRGRSAAAAAEQLRNRGYEAVHLEGGMDAWRAL